MLITRERRYDDRELPPEAAPVPPNDTYGAAQRMLAAGADAIARALSQDSAAYLAANRQKGGQ